jgi:hypothetical protein
METKQEVPNQQPLSPKPVAQSVCLSHCAALSLVNVHFLLTPRNGDGGLNPGRAADQVPHGQRKGPIHEAGHGRQQNPQTND